jgi:WD40 repeat protein
MKITIPLALLSVLFTVPCASASEARIIGITDEGAPVPAMASVFDYHGPLPAAKVNDRAIPQMPGFPVQMGGHPNFSPTRGLVFADLDGDDQLEIITSSTDGKIYAWDNTGKLMPGFPVTTIQLPQYAPSVDDMDGDGDVEIVQFTRGLTDGGRLYVLDHEGNALPGFPLSLNNNNIASCPTLYDLDDDGVMEIIAGERAYPIGYLHIIELDGSEWGGAWPVALDHVPTGTAAVGDVNNDGAVEIFYMSYDSMYLLDTAGHTLSGWPKQIPNANFSYQSAALADLDGDGDLEIVVGAHKSAAGCYVFHHDGTAYPGWPKLVGTWTYCPPTVTDFEGDGELEILDGRAGVFGDPNSAAFWAWTSSGVLKPGFPYVPSHGSGGGSDGPLTVADINGDGLMEIFADHNIASAGEGYLFGVDSSGKDLPGFPLRPIGFTYMNGATIGDVDGDGDYELGVLSSHTDETVVDVNLYDLPDVYSATDRDWKVYHARNRRGGLYPAVDETCPADFDGDGDVDTADLLFLLGAWGTPDGDVDGDGDTDTADLLALLAAWGECP